MANKLLTSLFTNNGNFKRKIHNIDVFSKKEKEYKMESVADEMAHTLILKILYLKNETLDYDTTYNNIFDEYIFTNQELEYVKKRTFKILKDNYNVTIISEKPLLFKIN